MLCARRTLLQRNYISTCSSRQFSTIRLDHGIDIAYDLHEPAKRHDTIASGAPIIFVHGLFGSKTNNRSMSKYDMTIYQSDLSIHAWLTRLDRAFARDLNRPVYAIDLRNHGDSSHDVRHDYTALSEDIEAFIKQKRLDRVTLIGHSMGAKAVMAVALRKQVRVASLIPVDNAPVDASLKTNFHNYVQAMRKIEEAGVNKQSEADVILQQYEEALPIRQFLLTNLVRQADGIYKWRIPLATLTKSLDKMGDFPFTDPDIARFEGPTLMIRGTRSPYVADEMLPIIGRFFPNFELRDIDAGHWVISEKPEDFRKG